MPSETFAACPSLPKKRFSEVDGLRAIACALVIIFHAGLWPALLHDLLVNTLGFGAIGVVMFFAISGFVIPDSLRGTRWQGIKTFSIRRFWRLYPPFWISLLLTWWIDDDYLSEKQQLGWDATMLPSLGVSGHGFHHFWTLEVELVFYFLIAALFALFGRLGWKVLLPVYLLLVALKVRKVVTPDVVINYDTMIPCLVVMFWGGICRETLLFDFSCFQWLAPRRGVNWARSSALGVVSGMTMAVLLMSYSRVRGGGRAHELVGIFGILGFLFWVILTPIRIDWLSRVGRWTYSTYLFHFLVIVIVRSLLNMPKYGDSSLVPSFFSGLCLLVSFALGALAYRWIERPSDQIGKQLTTKWQKSFTHSP